MNTQLIAEIGIFFAFVLGAFAAALILGVDRYIRNLQAEHKDLHKQSERLQTENRELKESVTCMSAELHRLGEIQAGRRHSHNTTAATEDALAVAVDVLNEYASTQMYTQARLKQLQGILQTMREGPHAYDPERPAGERPKRRKDA